MSKKKDPSAKVWFPLYVDDWDGNTEHLSCEEDGAYGRLVRFYWRNGPPPDHDPSLARIIREALPVWKRLRPILAPFFVITDGRWTHKRVDAERAIADDLLAKRVERSKAAARARWDAQSNAPGMLGASAKQCLDDAHTQPQSPTFGGDKEDRSQGDDLSPALRIVLGGRP